MAAGTVVHIQAESRRREELTLFRRMALEQNGAAREALVKRFLPLARKLAWNLRGTEDIDDLEQVAAIGLVKAIDRFDPKRGTAFSSYAMPTIVGELRRHLRDRGWSVRVPRDLKELAIRVEHATTELSAELGRSPTVAELSRRSGSTTERVLEALEAAAARHALSLDQPLARRDDPDATGREVPFDDPGYAAVEDGVVLNGLLSALPLRERRILELRFREDRLQRQIAESMGVSQMHVSRVIRAAIETLQKAAENEQAETDAEALPAERSALR